VKIAVDAVQAASQAHHFLAVTKQGRSAIATTAGNGDCHVILRGGKMPNYDAASIDAASKVMEAGGVRTALMIDASHGNSSKNYENQPLVVDAIAQQIEAGDRRIGGVMVESHLVAGRQDQVPGKPLKYGQSITDACIDWSTSVAVLDRLAKAVEQRRMARAEPLTARHNDRESLTSRA
jgi:3-deoxy-7-phosphoheptulonate synthase